MVSIVAARQARGAHLWKATNPGSRPARERIYGRRKTRVPAGGLFWGLTHYYHKVIQRLLNQPPDIVGFLVLVGAAVVAVSVHEFAHAVVARWQGDPTPKLAGRMTLNPRPHLDPVGSFIFLLVGFGWGKPVPVADNKLRSGRWGAVMVALAGPAANLLLAFFFALLVALAGRGATFNLERLILLAFFLNIMTALFNLLPVPPLDGFAILTKFLPSRRYQVIVFLERWSFLILLVAALLVFRTIAAPFADAIGRALLRIAGFSG